MLKNFWLLTGPDRLVELGSGRRVEVRHSEGDSLCVWLCGDGPDVLLFEGPESRSYLAGLARILAAARSEDVIRFGRRAAATV